MGFNVIDTYPRPTIEYIIREIDKYSIISFDVFDTLLKRDVYSPQDVFDLVEKIYNKRFQKAMTGFRKLRVDAEDSTRHKYLGREITLKEIYNQLIFQSVFAKDVVEQLCDIEREAERMVCRPNPFMREIYDYCVEHEKKILIISDMYLEGDFIEELLRGSGYDHYQAIYVSSEYGKQKRNGELYRLVQVKENISTRDWLHIGDSKRADYLAAKRVGIHAICIATQQRNTKYYTAGVNTNGNILYSFINNRASHKQNRNVSIGYEVYGPLLYGFTKWISEKIDPQKTTLFFARDCFVVLPAYHEFVGDSTRDYYFEASRKSLIIPALAQDCTIKKAEALIRSEPARITLSGILRKFGLVPELYEGKAKQCGLQLDSVLHRDALEENEGFVKFWSLIEPDLKEKSNVARDGFGSYFQSVECTDELQVVDIGWRGTMQYCLKQLLPDSYNIRGYYLGVTEDTLLNASEYQGMFFSGKTNLEKRTFIAAISALIEIFFSAPHGSVEGYRSDGTVAYADYECEEYKESANLVKDLQDGALSFVRDFKRSPLSMYVDLNEQAIFYGLAQLGIHPQKQELLSFGRFPFHMGTTVEKIASPKSWICYILHPKRLLYDFANSNWKIAFMKRLLKVRLPYYRIFGFLYCINHDSEKDEKVKSK